MNNTQYIAKLKFFSTAENSYDSGTIAAIERELPVQEIRFSDIKELRKELSAWFNFFGDINVQSEGAEQMCAWWVSLYRDGTGEPDKRNEKDYENNVISLYEAYIIMDVFRAIDSEEEFAGQLD